MTTMMFEIERVILNKGVLKLRLMANCLVEKN